MEKIYALGEIENIAKIVIEHLVHDTVVFHAPMGAGKTTFIKALCKDLKVKDEVSSPTFSLVNEYRGLKKVLHFDLYRLETSEELYNIGIEDYIDQQALKLIEWPEHAIPILDNYHSIKIEILDENTRKLSFS